MYIYTRQMNFLQSQKYILISQNDFYANKYYMMISQILITIQ